MSNRNGSAESGISGLLIPALKTQPLQRIRIDGPRDVQRAVGGRVECFHYRAATNVCVYLNNRSKYRQRRNSRATWLFRAALRREGWIAGNVVVVGENSTGLTHLPAGYEEKICLPILGEPTTTAVEPGAVRYEWRIGAAERQSYVSLIACYRAPDMTGPARYAAMVLCERDRNGGWGRRPVDYGHLRVRYHGKVSPEIVQPFAEKALATFRMLYAEGEPRISSYFARSDVGVGPLVP